MSVPIFRVPLHHFDWRGGPPLHGRNPSEKRMRVLAHGSLQAC